MVPIIFASICCAYLGIASLINYYRDEKKEYILVIGEVVRSDRNKFYHRGYHGIGYIPVIEYSYNNNVYQVNHRVSSSKYGKNMEIVPNSKYHIGDKVELRVYVDQPEHALINDRNNILLPLYVGIPLTLLSIVLLCVAIIN
ncbi:DUF3592 domain-containing protein [Roseburia hominis]